MLNASRLLALLLLAAPVSAGSLPAGITCDADSDCFYVPPSARGKASVPVLVVLHCVGAKPIDLDTCRMIGDSLGWIMATCHATRNHRDAGLNDKDIVCTIAKVLARYPVDSSRLFLFGFSGQGVQAMATMFAHPELVRGIVAVCPHAAALPRADWATLPGHCAYLVTREKDWNRRDNEMMYRLFIENGMAARLAMTPGEHGPGPCTEILAGCRWLDQNCR